MQVLVVGAGAIGSVLGGFLAKAGHEVTLLGRAWHLEVVRRDGLKISGLWGEHCLRPLALATRPEEVPRGAAFDWIFVCVKAYQTAEAAAVCAGFSAPQTLLCAFQNGLGNYEALTATVPPQRVALGRVIFGVELEPGHARVTVCADDVLLGAPHPEVPGERLAQLAATLRASGIPCRQTPEILVAIWAKALYNCALNGLSTLFEAPYGRLLAHPTAQRLMRGIIEEAYEVAAAHRIRLEPATARAYLEHLFTQLIPKTAVHRSSMLQDVQRGRPTEIEALNGAIVRLGQVAGIPTPMNALVTRLVHTKEAFV